MHDMTEPCHILRFLRLTSFGILSPNVLKLLHLDLLVPNNLQLKIEDLTETVHVYERIIISILKNNGNCYRIFITCSDHSLVHVK